jgi:hypothetical protein
MLLLLLLSWRAGYIETLQAMQDALWRVNEKYSTYIEIYLTK